MLVKPISCVLVFLSVLIGSGCGPQTARLETSPSVPAAVGEARLTTDENANTRVELQVKHLAPVENLTPPKNFYVVWAESPEGKTMNLGRLMVRPDRTGRFVGITPLQVFRLLVTAEQDPLPAAPSSQVVLRTDLLRNRGSG